MFFHRTLATVVLLAVPAALTAQHDGAGAAPARTQTTAPREGSQFDFLVGEWELVVKVPAPSLAARLHGGAPKLVGSWKGWRAMDGYGVEDELRITDAAGNRLSLAKALRVYDVGARHWSSTTLDVYRARFSSATAEFKNGEMHQTSKGTDQEGKAFVQRTRFYEITPAGFRFQQDRSYDDGKSWTEGVLRIEAKRVAPTAAR